jgi:hypothetical protein
MSVEVEITGCMKGHRHKGECEEPKLAAHIEIGAEDFIDGVIEIEVPGKKGETPKALRKRAQAEEKTIEICMKAAIVSLMKASKLERKKFLAGLKATNSFVRNDADLREELWAAVVSEIRERFFSE